MKKTGRKWSTVECPRCGDPHVNYSGKLDSKGVEYVVCGITNKRINVIGTGFHLTNATGCGKIQQ